MKKNTEIDELTINRIELIVKELKNSVSGIDILNWLNNFKQEDRSKALTILSKLEYISEYELIELLNERLKKILLSTSKDCNFIIHPIGEYGKSGTLMIYYIRKTPCFIENLMRFEFFESYNSFKKNKKNSKIKSNSVLIVLDDFLGSGFSLINYYKTYISPQVIAIPQIIEQYLVSIYHLDKAEKNIKRELGSNLKLISERKFPAFSDTTSIFGYRAKMLPIRELAFKYGKNLFSISNRETKKVEFFPLGYENSQALIIFPYNPPNNTLPIIWSSKAGWKPLYPRSQSEKINRSKALRKGLAHVLGLLHHSSEASEVLFSGSRDLGWKSFNFITKTDFTIFAILNMLKQKRPVGIICQELGIAESDFQNYIAEGVIRDIFNPDGSITIFGEKIYNDALKKLKYLKIEKNATKEFKIFDINYVPKIFNGRS